MARIGRHGADCFCVVGARGGGGGAATGKVGGVAQLDAKHGVSQGGCFEWGNKRSMTDAFVVRVRQLGAFCIPGAWAAGCMVHASSSKSWFDVRTDPAVVLTCRVYRQRTTPMHAWPLYPVRPCLGGSAPQAASPTVLCCAVLCCVLW